MFCPKCKLDVGNMDFCESCGGTTIKSDEKELNSNKKPDKNDKLKLFISIIIGVALVIAMFFVFKIINKPKTTTLEKALQEYYDTSNKEAIQNEVVIPQISQETTDELKMIADKFISKYYSNAPKEDYESFFSENSTDFYNDSNNMIAPFEFERSTDDKTEVQSIENVSSSLKDDTHATIKVGANIIRDGYDYDKVSENLSAENALIRVEDHQVFIFEFEYIKDSWLILKVSKPSF